MSSLVRYFAGRGKGGSSKVRTPYEAKNTLQSRAYVRFVDLVSEGPIEGFCNSAGVTVTDAQLYSDAQPEVVDGRLYFDPAKFEIEYDSGTSGPFTVFARVDSQAPLENRPLFTTSVGYPFSGANNTGLRVSITATFKESETKTGSSNETTTFKEAAEIYVQTYPKSAADQVETRRPYVVADHGFATGDVVYRKRTATNTYVWAKLPAGVSVFSVNCRVVTSITGSDSFVAAVYPICIEGRVRCLYVKGLGTNYLRLEPIVNPVSQSGHGFTVGTLIDFVNGVWVRASRYTQTVATVYQVASEDVFSARRQILAGPTINPPSVVAASIYLDDTPLADPDTLEFNFANVRVDYRLGEEIQTPLLGFEQTETLLSTENSVEIKRRTAERGSPAVVKDLATGDWDELVVNLMLPEGLYRQDMTNGDIFGLGDNYGEQGLASSTNAVPENQPPVIRITYRIITTDNSGAEQQSPEYPYGTNDGYVVIKGKTMSAYELSVRGSLLTLNDTEQSHHYRLYFYRVSPDDEEFTNSTARRSKVVVGTITGIVNMRMTYPWCAVVGIEIDAEQFNSIPTRGYHVKLRLVEVPTNYFPPNSRRQRLIQGATVVDFRTRAEYNRLPSGEGAYTDAGEPIEQTWDGTFYQSWTDNPAWITYSLCTDERVGFGSHIREANKWLFYKIARYCDQLVPTGWDGTQYTSYEARFSCSAYFQTASDAWKVLTDVSSSFSGFLFYQSGSVIPVQDCPREVRFAFVPANVENGFFSYTGIHKNGRYSTVVAKFSDPASKFKQTPVIAQDEDLTRKLGWRPLDRIAFGCTSKTQAQRFARRVLLSTKYLTVTVKFTTGLLGSVLRPGDVIEVYDPSRSSLPFGGRILEIKSATVDSKPILVLDRYITPEQIGVNNEELTNTFGIVCQRPMGVPKADEIVDEATLLHYMDSQMTPTLKVSSFARAPGGTTLVALADALPPEVEVGAVWGLRRFDVQPQTFQVLTIEETSPHKFAVVALEYQKTLYDAVDFDAAYDEPSVSPDLDGWKRPNPPRNLRIQYWPSVSESGQKIYKITVSWSPPADGFAKEYVVEWKRGLGDYQLLTTTQLTTAETIVVAGDNYCAQVRSVGLTGKLSTAVEVCTMIGVQSVGNSEIVSGLEITGRAHDTLFTTADVSFDWRVNWSEATSELQSAVPPVLPPSVSDYEVTIYDTNMELVWTGSRVDTSFALYLDANRSLPGGPYREFIIGVQARTYDGALSKATLLRVSNERPAVPEFTFETDLNGFLLIKFANPTYLDFDKFVVWMSDVDGFTPSDETVVYAGPSSLASIKLASGTTSYIRVAALDLLARNATDANISDQFSVVGRRAGQLTVFDFSTLGWTS